MRPGERGLSKNLVAADVSPLTYLWGSLSRLTSTLRSAATEDGSAATGANWFMVPMHAQKRKEALHELSNKPLSETEKTVQSRKDTAMKRYISLIKFTAQGAK